MPTAMPAINNQSNFRFILQERDLSSISSTRRNPVLADIFGRLGYMERQGSGFKKITESYHAAHNYRTELEPKSYSDVTSFQVTLYNLNYGTEANATKVTIEAENVAIEVAIDRLNASQTTIAKAKAVFANIGIDGVFGRSDIAAITKDSVTAAGNLIAKLKNMDSHRPNISSVISGYKQPSKSAQSIEITGFIEKSKPSQIIFLYTLLPLTA